jgi:DNA end-binding protein Ku
LRTLVEAKLEQGDALDTEATFGRAEGASGGEVLDLMEALRRSVERQRVEKQRGESKRAAAPQADATEPARKKPAAKKAAAKKSA